MCASERRGESARCRPLLLHFDVSADIHVFLRHAKTSRNNGLRVDDYLTKEQEERQALSADLLALKEKKYKSFFRASACPQDSCEREAAIAGSLRLNQVGTHQASCEQYSLALDVRSNAVIYV